jgi:CubicO group peptidase (beta-lactamase class C family)
MKQRRTQGIAVNARAPRILIGALIVFLFLAGRAAAQYVPPAGSWEHRKPAEVGLDEAAIKAAIDFAQGNESKNARDLLETHYRTFAREPFGEAVGPFKTRGPQTGVIVKDGYVVAERGDPARVDMTFSVSKSFLSTTVGLAWAEGLVGDVDDRVGPCLPPILLPPGDGEPGRESGTGFGARRPVQLFESEHNPGDHVEPPAPADQ